MAAETTQMAPGLSSLPENTETTYLMKNYARYPVEFVKGNGYNLYDSEGKEYLDFLSGIAVTGFGHNHPEIKEAVVNQVNSLWHVSNLFSSSSQEILAGKLAKGSGLDSVFFCNSGTEANEAAIKFARKWGKGRDLIITAIGGFHGRTMGSLSATGQYKVWEGFTPLTPGFQYIPFGDLEVLNHIYTPHLAAIMVEPVQGESGIIVPPDGYLKGLREFCDKHHILLILDEVQAGMGRTGKLFAHQWEGIKPDIITVAKGIANGIPLGAAICAKHVADEIKPGNHGSTFGGNPLAVAAANKVLDLLTSEEMNKISSLGSCLKESIASIGSDKIKEIRGKGLLIGVELADNVSAKSVAKAMMDEGVVIGTSGDSVLRLLPPFVIGNKEIQIFTNTLTKVLSGL